MNLYEMLEYVMNGGMATYEGWDSYVSLNGTETLVSIYSKKIQTVHSPFVPAKLDKGRDWIPYQPKLVLSEDEKVILRNIDKTIKWLARDSKGDIFGFYSKPLKCNVGWMTTYSNPRVYLRMFNHLFKFTKWEDAEPTLIEDLLK